MDCLNQGRKEKSSADLSFCNKGALRCRVRHVSVVAINVSFRIPGLCEKYVQSVATSHTPCIFVTSFFNPFLTLYIVLPTADVPIFPCETNVLIAYVIDTGAIDTMGALTSQLRMTAI